MTTRLSSFTEYALLNRWALDLFSPSDFQKRGIDVLGRSVSQTLVESKVNPYSNLQNSSYLYYANKYFITAPIKAAYVALVTLTLSRVGVVVNGALTTLSYLRYQYNPSDTNWEKTKDYAFAFFADLTSAIIGTLLTKTVVESTFYTLHFARIGTWMGPCKLPMKISVLYGVFTLSAALLGIAGLNALQNSSIAPQFFARPQDRVGMYLSLALRQKLGLVDGNGGLLPFSKDDRFEYTETAEKGCKFQGSNFRNLATFIFNAEWELLETVKECNQILPPEKKIRFQYPFDGESLARSLDTSPSSSSATTLVKREEIPLHKLRCLGRKIKVLKELFDTAQKLTLNDSIPVMFLKAVIKVNYNRFIFKELPSFIEEKDYKEYFNLKPEPQRPNQEYKTKGQKSSTNGFPWDLYAIDAINPKLQKRPATDIADQFSYDIGVYKWRSKNPEEVKPLRELFGLEEKASYADYKATKRKYQLAIHPDKNPKINTTELYKCLNDIFNILDKEYEKDV